MKTKVLMAPLIAAVIALSLCACTQQAASNSAAASEASSSEISASQASASGPFATIGDVLAAKQGDYSSIYGETSYTCAFESDGVYYRVSAELPEGLYDKIQEAGADESKIESILSPVAVTKTEVIAESAPSQEELDALVGKTGAEIAAEGYVIDGLVVNGNETNCSASKKPFSYSITFEGAVADEDTDDPAGAVADMTVASVGFAGLSWDVLNGE